MDDLMDRSEGVPEIELYVKGGGFELSRNVFRLNAFGETKYRGVEEKGEIKDWVIVAQSLDGVLSVRFHTHDDEGKHLDVFAAEDLHVGDEFNRDVLINKSGVQIPLEIRMKYRLAR